MDLFFFNYVEMLACLVSIIYAKRLARTNFWVLTPYMIMIVIAETIGKYLAEKKLYIQNVHMFNITTVIEFMVFYYLYYKQLHTKNYKKTILYCTPIYLLLTAVNQIYIQGFDNLHTYTLVAGTLFLMLFILFYFYETLSSMEPVILTREPLFWISTGLFLFYLGDMTYNLMLPYMIRNHMQKQGMHLFRLINNNLIIFEYTCFIIAIVLCGNSNRSASKLRS